jgi:acyl-CoA thioester hydrolase
MELPYTSRIQYRVLYADTDMAGVVYYGNYGRLFELGRTEMVRDLGLPYIELEKAGIIMPVYSVESRYRNVIRYDELITIETTIKQVPVARMEFFHRIYNESGTLAHEAKVVLAFLDRKTSRPVRAPERLLELFRNPGSGGSAG